VTKVNGHSPYGSGYAHSEILAVPLSGHATGHRGRSARALPR